MSASFNVAAIGNLSFSAITSPTGWPQDRGWMETESLSTPGVNNQRWRQRRTVLRDWDAECIMGVTTYANALAEARMYQSASGRTGTLTLTVSSTVYTWTNVHAELLSYSITSGPIFGAAVTSNSTHQVKSSWRFTMTDLTVTP